MSGLSHHTEHRGPDRVLLGVSGPFLLGLGPLAVVKVGCQVVDVLIRSFRAFRGVDIVEDGNFVIRHLASLAAVQPQEGRVALDVGKHLPVPGRLVSVDVVVVDVPEATVGIGARPGVEFLRPGLVGRDIPALFRKVRSIGQRGIFFAPLVVVVVLLVLKLGPEIVFAVPARP